MWGRMNGDRLPALGPRGEGWVGLQLLAYGLTAGAGFRGPPWPPTTRPPLRRAAGALAVTGAALLVGGSVSLGSAITPNPQPREGAALRTRGIYALVRHPIYGGVMLGSLAWSLWMSPAALAPAALTGALLDLKARREETLLERRHPAYAAYRARVTRRFLWPLW